MQRNFLVTKILDILQHVIVLENDSVKSSGSAILLDQHGTLLTVAHNIMDLESGKLLGNKIIAKSQNFGSQFYEKIICRPEITILDTAFQKPIRIDLALLKPQNNNTYNIHATLAKDLGKEGDDVLMAGFPDEVKLPFNFQGSLNTKDLQAEEVQKLEKQLKYGIRSYFIKHAMIGKAINININARITDIVPPKKVDIKGVIYWADNVSNNGSSGRPVINDQGELIGVICKKGLTGDLKEVAGSTMIMSYHLITWFLEIIPGYKAS